jgi:hypothetical protein
VEEEQVETQIHAVQSVDMVKAKGEKENKRILDYYIIFACSVVKIADIEETSAKK